MSNIVEAWINLEQQGNKFTWVAFGNGDGGKLSLDRFKKSHMYIGFNKESDKQSFNDYDYTIRLPLSEFYIAYPHFNAPLTDSINLTQGIGCSADKEGDIEKISFKRNSIAKFYAGSTAKDHGIDEPIFYPREGLLLHGDDKEVAQIVKVVADGAEYSTLDELNNQVSGYRQLKIKLNERDINANKGKDIYIEIEFHIMTSDLKARLSASVSFERRGGELLGYEASSDLRSHSSGRRTQFYIASKQIQPHDISNVNAHNSRKVVKVRIPHSSDFTGLIAINMNYPYLLIRRISTSSGMHLLGGALGKEVSKTVVKVPAFKNLPSSPDKSFYITFDLFFPAGLPPTETVNILTMVPKKGVQNKCEPVTLNVMPKKDGNGFRKSTFELQYPTETNTIEKLDRDAYREAMALSKYQIVIAYDNTHNWIGLSIGSTMKSASDVKFDCDGYENIKLGDFLNKSYAFCIKNLRIYHGQYTGSFR